MVSGLPDWHGSINIAKQTLANVDMNINAQTLSYVRIKSLYGSPHVVRTSSGLSPGATWTVVDVSGEGYFMYVFVDNYADGDAELLAFELRIDDEVICYSTAEAFNSNNYGTTGFPYRLYVYSSTHCVSEIILPYPLPYGSSLKLTIDNQSDSYLQNVYIRGLYTIT